MRPEPSSLLVSPDAIRPTLEGVWLRSMHDALLVVSRCLDGDLQMVHRRPYDIEKKELVQSGSVFVYSKRETKIDRWTDEKLWTPSRQSESFFFYRQRNETQPRLCKGTPRQKLGMDVDYSNPDERARSALTHALYGGWAQGSGFTQNGLMKKTITIKVPARGQIGVVCYFDPLEVLNGTLQTPSVIPVIAAAGILSVLSDHGKQLKKPVRSASKPCRSSTSTRSARSARSTSSTTSMRPYELIPSTRRASALSVLSAISSDSEVSSFSTDSSPSTPMSAGDALAPLFAQATTLCAPWPLASGAALAPADIAQATAPIPLAAIDLRVPKPAPAMPVWVGAPYINPHATYDLHGFPHMGNWVSNHPWDPVMTADPPPPYAAYADEALRYATHNDILGAW